MSWTVIAPLFVAIHEGWAAGCEGIVMGILVGSLTASIGVFGLKSLGHLVKNRDRWRIFLIVSFGWVLVLILVSIMTSRTIIHHVIR